MIKTLCYYFLRGKMPRKPSFIKKKMYIGIDIKSKVSMEMMINFT